jgi:hypothetical protein
VTASNCNVFVFQVKEAFNTITLSAISASLKDTDQFKGKLEEGEVDSILTDYAEHFLLFRTLMCRANAMRDLARNENEMKAWVKHRETIRKRNREEEEKEAAELKRFCPVVPTTPPPSTFFSLFGFDV